MDTDMTDAAYDIDIDVSAGIETTAAQTAADSRGTLLCAERLSA